MKIYDLAMVCRSKNAGPFQVTIDLMFDNETAYYKVLASPSFSPENIGDLYNLPGNQIAIKQFDRILTIKVVLPRKTASGSPGDSDVYGSQQHFPLGNIEIADK